MSVISALADTVSRKPNPRKYPANRPLKAPLVRAKLDTTLAELEKLKSRHPDAALRATLGEDGGAEAFHELRDQIAEQEQIVAVLTSALGAAEADDNTLRQQQIAALRANEIVEVKQWDAIRFDMDTMRNVEAGPDGIEYLAFGAGDDPTDAEMVQNWWTD